MNRQERRKAKRNQHHNIHTKRYHSAASRERSIKYIAYLKSNPVSEAAS